MERVRCMRCGSTGYTASPFFVKCQRCGGSHAVVERPKSQRKALRRVAEVTS